MTTNRTSEAIEDALKFMEEAKAVRPNCKISVPVLALVKYQRMEEALRVIHKEAHRHDRGDEFTETNDVFRNCYMHADDALAFDPLAPTQKPE